MLPDFFGYNFAKIFFCKWMPDDTTNQSFQKALARKFFLKTLLSKFPIAKKSALSDATVQANPHFLKSS